MDDRKHANLSSDAKEINSIDIPWLQEKPAAPPCRLAGDRTPSTGVRFITQGHDRREEN